MATRRANAVRETAPRYGEETGPDAVWSAFTSLDRRSQQAVLLRLVGDRRLRRQLLDLLTIEQEAVTKADVAAIERGRRAIAQGDYVTLDELCREVDSPRRVARRKSARPRARR
jgi:predicted transcriptional regulator